MHIKEQSFLVLGVSKSGFAAAKYILTKGGKCYFYEELDSPKIQTAKTTLVEMGGVYLQPQDLDLAINDIDALIVSPGVPINHQVAIKCKQAGKRIMGEVEFGFACFSPIVIGVTGTNGKTTTVSMLDAILKTAQIKSLLVGNVGVPVSEKLEELDNDIVCVAEISSFQLESVSDFKPHIACILNISPDHLERHYSMENYVFLKKRILKNLKESEYAVLNYDDQTVKEFHTETRAKVLWISARERVDGVYAEDGKIYFKGEYVTDIQNLAMGGIHNLYNSMFAVCAAKLVGVNNQDIQTALQNFKGVPHRIELVADINGVKYFNDSKATNTASTITAINSLTCPIVLILGGSEKGEDYKDLFNAVKLCGIKHTVITGASRYNMLEAGAKAGVADITVTSDFVTAVKIAQMFATEGDAVLLSPACASFDCFSGYEERGNLFTQTVNQCR